MKFLLNISIFSGIAFGISARDMILPAILPYLPDEPKWLPGTLGAVIAALAVFYIHSQITQLAKIYMEKIDPERIEERARSIYMQVMLYPLISMVLAGGATFLFPLLDDSTIPYRNLVVTAILAIISSQLLSKLKSDFSSPQGIFRTAYSEQELIGRISRFNATVISFTSTYVFYILSIAAIHYLYR